MLTEQNAFSPCKQSSYIFSQQKAKKKPASLQTWEILPESNHYQTFFSVLKSSESSPWVLL